MAPSNFRSHLLAVFAKHHGQGVELSHWEFTRADESALFEFIHPSVNTRDHAFRLFNLPVKWDKPTSALVDHFGKRTPLTTVDALAAQASSCDSHLAEICAKYERQGAHPDAARKAAEIEARGAKVCWSYGHPHEGGPDEM